MKKLIEKSLLVLAFIYLMMLMSVTVLAADSFTPRTTAPSTTNKYYIHTSNGGLNQCIEIDKTTGSCLPNCVGYAWGRAYEILGTQPKLSKGHAKNWYSYNKNGGYYDYDEITPKLGAIMCWSSNHVAVVEKIEGNYITISESSYNGFRFDSKTLTISEMEDKDSGFQGYIYIGDFSGSAEDQLTISFYANGGDGNMSSHTVTYGNSFIIPDSNFENVGYTFGGWVGYRPKDKTYYVKGEGWFTESEIKSNGYEKRIYMPGEEHVFDDSWTNDPTYHTEIAFVATWIPNTYPISFGASGAAGTINPIEVQLLENFVLPESTAFNKPGYEFNCWNAYRTSDGTYYVSGKGWFTVSEMKELGYTKKAYYPGGEYYIDSSAWLSDDISNNDTDFIFKAVWEPKTYQISFGASGATGTIDSLEVQLLETFVLPESTAFKKPGYEFNCWNAYRTSDGTYYVEDKGWFTVSEMKELGYTKKAYYPGEEHCLDSQLYLSNDAVNNDTDFIFKALWEPNTYQVSFGASGAVGSIDSLEIQLLETFVLPEADAFYKPGYEFNCWNAYRTSDGTYYVENEGWFTVSELNNLGYTKKAYYSGDEYYIDPELCLSNNISNNDTDFIFKVLWEPIKATLIDLGIDNKEMNVGDVLTIHAVVEPAEAVHTVTWATSDESVATVDESGAVTAVGEGEALITATTVNGLVDTIKIIVLNSMVAPDVPDTAHFKDVNDESWYYEAVKYVFENNLMTGLTITHFGPGGILSREQFATILYRMNGSPAVDTANIPFTDVLTNDWYTNAVLWANESNIISGYNATTFGTGDPITREQMAVMMHRYGQYMGYDVTARAEFSQFADAEKVGTFAQNAMQWVIAEGIISGNGNGTLNPQGGATRAECASIIMRFDQKYS